MIVSESDSSAVSQSLPERLSAELRILQPDRDDYIPQVVNVLLKIARQNRASDLHLIPREHDLLAQFRIDGVLHDVAGFDRDIGTRLIARFKVLAGLLTYRSDLPQEGRISQTDDASGETRVTTFPTLFGEKAAVRLFADAGQLLQLNELGLPADIEGSLRDSLQMTSGVILLTGPSGSGKTTTVYACLRELVQLYGTQKGLMTLEDPIEVVVPGVTQSQVRDNVGFSLATGLRSMMRQDPDVIMVGEVRDPETAECAFQAALTGHLVLTTFHAGSSAEAVARLLDMGVEPYLVNSTLRSVICQRLLRRSCSSCGGTEGEPGGARAINSDKPQAGRDLKNDCTVCHGLQFHGRFVTAEWMDPNLDGLAAAINQRLDARSLQRIARESGMQTLRDRAAQAVDSGQTTQAEVFRVLGSDDRTQHS
jgi:type II secretory ATPase GspE/PulE/Tfp pilus assembly ATPase PilB-like protein